MELQGHVVVCLHSQKESPIYQEDWLGLRALDESGRLSLMNTTCIHQDYDTECFDKYFMEGVFPLLAD